jgi:glycogen debranching enzyme
MDDVIQVHDEFYILATESKRGKRAAVLKHGEMFAVFDQSGDIGAFGVDDQGLYCEGTRYLSRFRMRMNGFRPLLLSARTKEDSELFTADLTNPDIPTSDTHLALPRDLVHVFRGRFLWNGTLHEGIRLWNYGQSTICLSLAFELDADFADIFEIRGTARERRGSRLPAVVAGSEWRLGYHGLDGETRTVIVDWSEPPAAATPTMARFDYDLAPHSPAALSVAIRCDREHHSISRVALEVAEREAASALERGRAEFAEIETSSERFDQWVRRSASDLRMLITTTPHGEYPYAGVPWFSAPFGRDGIITGLQTLWINPAMARGVLEYLAATQADHVDPAREAQPGKILHEMRTSEMARLGEVPFGRYYGSVDATPLFVVLAGAYFERTGDAAFARRLWPHVQRALDWIDTCGDVDGDGFVEYVRRGSAGLIQQGWKDSHDSVFHADGALADPPVALCEVQGYVFDAKCRAATIADALGDHARASALRQQAARLRAAFNEVFWCEEESTYALALDGHKRCCRVRTSNAGHCLFSGIASTDRARRVGEQLLGDEMFSGWGIRTLSSIERRYNPMSYHNGSVWPHDNSLIAVGLSHYGFDDLTPVPMTGLFNASLTMDGHRLPELFCGFRRRSGEGPTLYPVACSPQAWASGAVFGLLQAFLRLSLDIQGRRLSIGRALLPPFLKYLRLLNLRVPFGSVDLQFTRHHVDVSVSVLGKSGDFDVFARK